MDFYNLNLSDPVLDALDDMNFQETTPIQEHAIPPILEGRDLLGVAQTGTGKTAAYLLPVLSELSYGDYPTDAINCIIMSPTRELAQQIDQALQGFSYHLPYISSVAVYGGNDGIRYEQEKRSMQQGADIVIATPGRLISHLSLGNIDLSRVSFFILDEADRMLDMGFCNDIMTIAKQLPKNRQTMLFSATMPEEIRKLARDILTDPLQITLALAKPADGITQQAYICHEGQKLGILNSIFDNESSERVILFASRKTKVKEISHTLKKHGFNVGEMHSDLSQSERDEIMFQYKSRKIDMIVATDILARGIDIDDIRIVINYDVPRDCDDYIHRIGRTARAGTKGRAITLVNVEDQEYFKRIEDFIEQDVPKMGVPATLGEAPAYEPKSKQKGGRNGRGSNKEKQGGNNRRKNNRKHGGNKPSGGEKPKAATPTAKSEKPKDAAPVAAQQEGTPKQQGEKTKRRRPHHRRRKPGNAKGGESAAPVTENKQETTTPLSY